MRQIFGKFIDHWPLTIDHWVRALFHVRNCNCPSFTDLLATHASWGELIIIWQLINGNAVCAYKSWFLHLFIEYCPMVWMKGTTVTFESARSFPRFGVSTSPPDNYILRRIWELGICRYYGHLPIDLRQWRPLESRGIQSSFASKVTSTKSNPTKDKFWLLWQTLK